MKVHQRIYRLGRVGLWAALLPGAAIATELDCMIQPGRTVLVGSPVPGVIEKVTLERGDTVQAGQVVAQLRADVERAALDLARLRARQSGELAAARSSQEYAQAELGRAADLHQQNFVSGNYLEKQRAEAQIADGRTEQAQERRRLTAKEVELAEAQLALRTIRAPIGGVVVDRLLSPGEHVDMNPILRLASIDPLRVDVLVPAAAFGAVALGMKGSVVPELLQRTEHVAVVTNVDRVIDPASNTFRVRLELPNPKHALPAGLRCKVDLGIALPESARGAGRDARRAPVPRAASAAPASAAASTAASAAAPSSASGAAPTSAPAVAPASVSAAAPAAGTDPQRHAPPVPVSATVVPSAGRVNR